jgi:hypothetical protein
LYGRVNGFMLCHVWLVDDAYECARRRAIAAFWIECLRTLRAAHEY